MLLLAISSKSGAAGRQLKSLARSSWRRTAEERTWGGPGECEAWFHNHDRFTLKGMVWRLERDSKGLPRVMGGHRNVAAYRSGSRRLAVKAVPFESVGDLACCPLRPPGRRQICRRPNEERAQQATHL